MKVILRDVLKKTTSDGYAFFEILNDGEVENGCFRAKSKTVCIAVGCNGSLEVDAWFGASPEQFGELIKHNLAKCDTCELDIAT